MHTLIFLNGDSPSEKVLSYFLKESNFIIAADGGANYLKSADMCPDVIIGDLDSVKKETLFYFRDSVKIIKIRDQNTTDFEKCLLLCVKENRKKVIVFGSSGDRIDHTLNNFSILKRYCRKLDIRLISGDYEIFFINKNIEFPYRKKEIVSLLGMPKALKINSRGLKFKLKDMDLEFGVKEGALNESTSSRVSIEFKSGYLLLFKKHFIE